MKKIIFILFLVLGPLYGAQAQDDNEWCAYCHATKLQKKYTHGSISKKCTFCHVSHNATTENPARLSKKINDLCLSCHDDMPSQGSIDHFTDEHPHSLEKDPLHPEKEFSCASCHNPHSANMEKLFRYNYREGETPYKGLMCAVCHWDLAGGGTPPPPPPPWE